MIDRPSANEKCDGYKIQLELRWGLYVGIHVRVGIFVGIHVRLGILYFLPRRPHCDTAAINVLPASLVADTTKHEKRNSTVIRVLWQRTTQTEPQITSSKHTGEGPCISSGLHPLSSLWLTAMQPPFQRVNDIPPVNQVSNASTRCAHIRNLGIM